MILRKVSIYGSEIYGRSNNRQAMVQSLQKHCSNIVANLHRPFVEERRICMDRLLNSSYVNLQDASIVLRNVGTFEITKEFLRSKFTSIHLGLLMHLFQERDNSICEAHRNKYQGAPVNVDANNAVENNAAPNRRGNLIYHKLEKSLFMQSDAYANLGRMDIKNYSYVYIPYLCVPNNMWVIIMVDKLASKYRILSPFEIGQLIDFNEISTYLNSKFYCSDQIPVTEIAWPCEKYSTLAMPVGRICDTFPRLEVSANVLQNVHLSISMLFIMLIFAIHDCPQIFQLEDLELINVKFKYFMYTGQIAI